MHMGAMHSDCWILGAGVRDGRGCWKLNLDLLEEQQVLLTPEPSLQHLPLSEKRF